MTRTYPDVLLERYRLDELPAGARAEVERELAGNPALRARVDALAQSDADIQRRYPAAALLRRAAAVSPRRSRAREMILAGALATAAVTLLVTLPRVPHLSERPKGDAADRPVLALYRWTPTGSERLADGDLARSGDLLRVGYSAGGRGYGVILSIDGRGTVTLHLPPAGDEAARLGQDKVVLLESAYELDEAPRIERFYFVTSQRPFKVAAVMRAAEHVGARAGALVLPSGLDQITLAVQKEVQK